MTHEGSSDDMDYSSWPSGGDGGGAVAGPPTAPVAAAAAGGVLTVGSIATVAGTLLIFVVIAAGFVSLQYFFDARRDDDDDDRGSRHGGRAPRRRGGGGGIRAGRGVDPDVLRSLPVTVYRAAAPGSGKEEEEGAVECAVCLAELEDGEAARFLPRCGHGFHAACVDTWLAAHTTCPLCRLTVAKPDSSPAPAVALLPVPPEPANYAATANMPASVLLGVSGHGAVAAATMASDGDTTSASAGTAAVLVIEIPELAVPTPTPRGAAKSPGSARLRSSFRRLWSFGRQGAGPSSSCSCGAGAGEGADVEQGTSVTIGIAVVAPRLPSEAAASPTHQGSAV